MRLFTGTSGYSYSAWKGPFYPEDLKDADMLRYYGERLSSVEINNTFYRMPKREVLARWYDETPEGFRFVLKASRRITHQAKLKDVEDSVGYLLKQSAELREKRGPLLFQLPPYLKKDLGLLRSFLDCFEPGAIPEESSRPEVAIEFRSRSWYVDEVIDLLGDRNIAFCVTDWEDEEKQAPLVRTAPFSYFRLRREAYEDTELAAWRSRIEAVDWTESYVFFKHEDDGIAAKLAAKLAQSF